MTSLPGFISATPDPVYAPGIPAAASHLNSPYGPSTASETPELFAGLLKDCTVTPSPTPATPGTAEGQSAPSPLAAGAQWLRIETSPPPITAESLTQPDTSSTGAQPAGSKTEPAPCAPPPPANLLPAPLLALQSLGPAARAPAALPAGSPAPLEAEPAPSIPPPPDHQASPAREVPPELVLGLLPADYRIQNIVTPDRDTEASLHWTQPQPAPSATATVTAAAAPLASSQTGLAPLSQPPADRPASTDIAPRNQSPKPGPAQPAATSALPAVDPTPAPLSPTATSERQTPAQTTAATTPANPPLPEEPAPALSLEKIAASLRTLSNHAEKPADTLPATASLYSDARAIDPAKSIPGGVTAMPSFATPSPDLRLAPPAPDQTTPAQDTPADVATSASHPPENRIQSTTTGYSPDLPYARRQQSEPAQPAQPAQPTATPEPPRTANTGLPTPPSPSPELPAPANTTPPEQAPLPGQQNAGGLPTRSPASGPETTTANTAPKPAAADAPPTHNSAPTPQTPSAGSERPAPASTTPATTTTANSQIPNATTPAFSLEKIAASLRTLSNQPANTTESTSKNKFLSTDKQVDAKSKAHHGIVNAKPLVEMTPTAPIDPAQSAPASGRDAPMPTPSREMPARSIMELVQSSAAPQTAASSTTPAPDATLRRELSLPSADPVAVVREVAELTHDFRFHERNSVEVKFNFKDNTELSVRIAYKDGDVQATFLTDSPELRATLGREWQSYVAQMPQEPRAYRMADPVFSTSGDLSGNTQGRDPGSPGGGDSRQQQSSSHSDQSGTQRQAPQSFGFGANTSAKSAPAPGPAPRVSTERLLHAFA